MRWKLATSETKSPGEFNFGVPLQGHFLLAIDIYWWYMSGPLQTNQSQTRFFRENSQEAPTKFMLKHVKTMVSPENLLENQPSQARTFEGWRPHGLRRRVAHQLRHPSTGSSNGKLRPKPSSTAVDHPVLLRTLSKNIASLATKNWNHSNWLVVWLPFLFSQKNWESHHPNWRTHIFQRGGPGPPTSWCSTIEMEPPDDAQEASRCAVQISRHGGPGAFRRGKPPKLVW